MKKNMLATILLFIGILFLVSCANKPKNESSKQNSKVTSATKKEYKDDTISCSYNDSLLKYQRSSSPDDNLLYCLMFSDDPMKLQDDLKNNSYLSVSTVSHSISYDDSKAWMLPSLTKTFFNGTFNIEDNDSIKVNELKDNIYEYTYQTDGIEYYGCLYYINNSEMTVSICQILPDEKQEYKDALKSCYKSIKYIKSSDSIEEINESNKEPAQNSGQITSGNLYNAIKKIDSNTYNVIKVNDDSYGVILLSNNPKTFFKNCENIYKKAFKKDKSVVFEMQSKKKETIITLNVVNDKTYTFPIYATLIFNDKKWQKKVKNAYKKNKFWQSVDFDNLNNKEFQKIIDKYSK